MKPIVEVKNLCKQYGKVRALDDLSLTVYERDIYGFIGPNGAGKTTTFTILATILKPGAGSVFIDGLDIRQGELIRPIIGYMPDTFGVYEDMTVYQYLDFFGAAYYIPVEKRKGLIADILQLTDLDFKKEAMVRSLSRGMQQRLGVARVLIHDPKLLILDEPASGLDPRARVELRELLKELSGMGKTILISSHILSELSEICNRVGIIEQGKLVFEGSQMELSRLMMEHATITIETVPEDADAAFDLLKAAEFTGDVSRSDHRISLRLKDGYLDLHAVPALLVAKGCRITRFNPEQTSLENAFMALTKGKLA
jgi:ABC-2 type transport system ATP-binding protein